jgi:hypothetical protein
MSIAVNIIEPRLLGIQITEDEIVAHLADGRTISVPLAWSWRLSEASPDQRQKFEIIGDGQGIRWPEIDEDISVEGMLCGSPARRPKGFSNPQGTVTGPT